MALVHKTKKKTQKKQQIFKIKLRKDKVKMFGPHSKPISVVQAWFKADFDCWPIQFDSADTTRFWPNRPVLAKIKAKLAWIPKKKKNQTWHQRTGSVVDGRTPCQATLDSGGAPSQTRCCFLASIPKNSGAKRCNDPNHYEN